MSILHSLLTLPYAPLTTLYGLIFMLVLGPAVGNYACSVVYRLPRGKTPFERSPFCGHCNADLKPIDLFPILSWCMTRGRCRYCAGPIPSVYTVIEVACGAVFVAYFLHFGIGEPFLLYTAYAVFVIILAAIHWQQGWIAATIYSYAFACIALARTLAEHTIYGTVQSAFVMLMVMVAMWRVGSLLYKRPENTATALQFPPPQAGEGGVGEGAMRNAQASPQTASPVPPSNSPRLRGENPSPFDKPWIWWFTLMGALLPFAFWAYILPIYIAKLFVPKPARVIVYAAGALVLPLVS